MIKHLVVLTLLLALIPSSYALLDCNPDFCPEGYVDEGVTCEGDVCTRSCVINTCSDEWNQVYQKVTTTNEMDSSSNDVQRIHSLGGYTPTNQNGCYKFEFKAPTQNFWDNGYAEGDPDRSLFDCAAATYFDENDASNDNPWYKNLPNSCVLNPENDQSWGKDTLLIDKSWDSDGDCRQSFTLPGGSTLHCAPDPNSCAGLTNCANGCYNKGLEANIKFGYVYEDSLSGGNDYCNYEGWDLIQSGIEMDVMDFDTDKQFVYTVYEAPVIKTNVAQTCQRESEIPTINSIPDKYVEEDSSEQTQLVDLFDYHDDPDGSDDATTFTIVSQSNSGLINCFIESDRYVSCDAPAQDQTGTNTIKVRAIDEYNKIDEDEFVVFVTDSNDAPVFDTPTFDDSDPQNPTPRNGLVTFQAKISDPESNNVKLLICDNAGIADESCAGQKFCSSPALGYKIPGDMLCTFDTKDHNSAVTLWQSYACDSNGLCSQGSQGEFYLDVNPLTNLKITVGETVVFDDQEIIDTQLDIGQAVILHMINCQADKNGYCTIPIEIEAQGDGIVSLSNLNIPFTLLNRIPSADIAYDNYFKEGELVKINPIIYDFDDYQHEITYNDPLDENGEWQTDYADAGIYPSTILISDGSSQDAVSFIRIIVENVNREPSVEIISQQFDYNELDDISIPLIISDPDGEELEIDYLMRKDDGYLLNIIDYGAEITDNGFMWTPTKFDSGNYELFVSAEDEDFIAIDTFEFTVHDTNNAPTAQILLDSEEWDGEPIKTIEEATLLFTAIGTDLDEDDISYHWSLNRENYNPRIFETQDIEIVFDKNDAAEYELVLTVSDGQDETQYNVPISVSDLNSKPVTTIFIDDKEWDEELIEFNENEIHNFRAESYDLDQDTITHLWELTSINPEIEKRDFNGEDVDVEFDDQSAGVYDMKLTVYDGINQVSYTIPINVGNVNNPPTSTIKVDGQIWDGKELTFYTNESHEFTSDAIDLDGDPITYIWILDDLNSQDPTEIVVDNTYNFDKKTPTEYILYHDVQDGTDYVRYEIPIKLINRPICETCDKADLRPLPITYSSHSDPIKAGMWVLFESGVENIGDLDSEAFNVKWFIDGQRVGYWPHIGVAAGEIETEDTSYFVWEHATPGEHTIKFVVNADKRHVEESNYLNNETEITFTVQGCEGPNCILPDLEITHMKTEGQTTFKLGESALINATIANRGALDVGPFNLRWLYNGEVIGLGSHSGLKAGEITALGNSQILFTPQEAGTHIVELELDFEDLHDEKDDQNNKKGIIVSVE